MTRETNQEWMRRTNWPPMFESQITKLVSPTSKRFMTEYALGEQARRGGFNTHALGLAGAREYVVLFEAKKARELRK